MARLAIIPARGGSKRIPRKNIKNFHGKPIIAYSIEAALKSGLFDEVMVSTDDVEIKNISLELGAKVPFLRSENTSNDTATTLEVIREVLESYKKEDRTFDEVCCIYPTAPLMKSSHLTAGLDLLENEIASVFPVVPFSFPILRSLKVDEDNFVSMNWPEYSHTRSQDLPAAYHDAGQWYWLRPELISNSLYSDNSKVIILSEMEVQDIDNESDWKMAEVKWEMGNE
ncbi:MAG: pseudaminic acid cytidylyltransferase [Saprospiraceae bacterium]|jgi:pseudaminic acid cytidylyltransferase|nr:pseudaminic acid cytidylyltransferase [Candidatus Brachybacter algidus]MBP7541563.1 pseudaminic acid cytidylyltransferase [Saprospiraceae bacterium]MBK9023506.1 pseudaminic acid cytidylyltransferase [Candidatus Brachybacter algidus]MBP8894231.1 pseudaminic acid cytidylyltransferase [Saprospiraceae bacterium]MBP9127112.1 pseudaminic acid cytidylyltransferase [Saprospiraceae bacterium]